MNVTVTDVVETFHNKFWGLTPYTRGLLINKNDEKAIRVAKGLAAFALAFLVITIIVSIAFIIIGRVTGKNFLCALASAGGPCAKFTDLPFGLGTVNLNIPKLGFGDDEHFYGADDPAVGFYDEEQRYADEQQGFASGEASANADYMATGGMSFRRSTVDGIDNIGAAFYGEDPMAGFYGQESAAGDLYGNNPFADEPQQFADDPAVGFYDDQNQSFYDEPQQYADEYQGFVPGGVKYSAEDKDDLPWGLGRCKGKSKRGGPAYGSEDYLDAYFAQQKSKALK